MEDLFRKLVLGAVVCISAATNASAAVISHTDSFQLPNTEVTASSVLGPAVNLAFDTTTVSLPLFDPNLGTLQAAELTFNSNWSLRGSGSASAECFPTTGSICGLDFSNEVAISNDFSFELTLPVSQQIDSLEPLEQGSPCTGPLGSSVSCSMLLDLAGSFGGSFDVPANEVGQFTGTGDAFVLLSRLASAEVVACMASDTEGSASTVQDCSVKNSINAWAGNITMNYTFEPSPPNETPVPESGTLPLLGMGLLMLLVWRQHKE